MPFGHSLGVYAVDWQDVFCKRKRPPENLEAASMITNGVIIDGVMINCRQM
jgi:hypothetical protein